MGVGSFLPRSFDLKRCDAKQWALLLSNFIARIRQSTSDIESTELVSPVPAEIRALVLARNRHASGMAKVGRVGLVRTGLEGVADGGQPGGSALPPVIRRPRECGMCFQLSECMLYHRAVEGGDEESSGLDKGVFEKKVRVCRGSGIASSALSSYAESES